MLHASNLSRNVTKSRGSFYFSCNSQSNSCSWKMGCYTKQCFLQLATQRLLRCKSQETLLRVTWPQRWFPGRTAQSQNPNVYYKRLTRWNANLMLFVKNHIPYLWDLSNSFSNSFIYFYSCEGFHQVIYQEEWSIKLCIENGGWHKVRIYFM